MAYQANVLSVMIASPGDVTEQRDDIRQIVNDWNFVNALTRSLILMPIGWETHSAPDLGGRAQEIINTRVLANCDILVGVFWTKLGTPTGGFGSGTVEEITRHVEAGKPAMVYFSDAPVAPQSFNQNQFDKVTEFKDWCFSKGLVESFSNAEEFRQKFRSQLGIQLNTNPYLKGILEGARATLLTRTVIEISDDAKHLLLAAADDPSGHLIAVSTLGGRYIQVNGQTYGNPGEARSFARWEAALTELADLKYVIGRGAKGDIFQLTDAGYKRVDDLKGLKVDA